MDLIDVPTAAIRGILASLQASNWSVFTETGAEYNSNSLPDNSTRSVGAVSRLHVGSDVFRVHLTRFGFPLKGSDDQNSPSRMIAVVGREVDILTLIQHGYGGVLYWTEPTLGLLAGLECIQLGVVVFSQNLANRLRPDVPTSSSAGDLLTKLSEREHQVLTLIANGKTHRQVASELGLASTTVDTYVSRLQTKIGVRGVAELTRFAAAGGYLDSETAFLERVIDIE